MVLAIAAAGLAGSPDQLTLRLNLENGRTYRMKMVSEQKIAQTIMGKVQTIEQTMGLGCRLEVVDVDPAGLMTVRYTYDSCYLKQSGLMGIVEYDSANPPARIPEAAQGYAALAGLSFTMKFDSSGRTVDVQGIEAMIVQMLDRMNLPQGPARDQVMQTLRSQYNDEAMKQSMGDIMCPCPEKPVSVGDSWSKEVRVPMGFPMIIISTYTLVGRQDGLASLKVHSTVAPNKDAPPLEMQGMKMRYELAGEQDGIMEIAETTGLTVRATISQKFSGQVTVTMVPASAGSMSWPLSVEAVTRIEAY